MEPLHRGIATLLLADPVKMDRRVPLRLGRRIMDIVISSRVDEESVIILLGPNERLTGSSLKCVSLVMTSLAEQLLFGC